ncbi:otospiralin-like [Chanos chanos]|uniref:Otospiralin-like n=1 Tax=Chanos chanos TaxID=29144 RepID=A0A6J2W0C2_CHACN|nr:otospiralin-like [Chanos chanos]
MTRLCFSMVLLSTLLLGLVSFTGAEEREAEGRETRSVPNWALTSSDFFAWVEELRSHAGYDKIEELARTFWAHFPSASRLGYDPPAPEE